MIRDPSDGSVRDAKPGSSGAQPGSAPGNTGSSPVIDTTTSGLPITKAKAEYLARLELSREWLKDYFKLRDNEP